MVFVVILKQTFSWYLSILRFWSTWHSCSLCFILNRGPKTNERRSYTLREQKKVKRNNLFVKVSVLKIDYDVA